MDQTPPPRSPNSHRLEGPPPPGVQWTAGPGVPLPPLPRPSPPVVCLAPRPPISEDRDVVVLCLRPPHGRALARGVSLPCTRHPLGNSAPDRRSEGLLLSITCRCRRCFTQSLSQNSEEQWRQQSPEQNIMKSGHYRGGGGDSVGGGGTWIYKFWRDKIGATSQK